MSYKEFIEACKVKIYNTEYLENHHIIPKSCGGTNDKDNLVYLSLPDHWMAHKLYAEENPDLQEAQDAFMSMGPLESFIAREKENIDNHRTVEYREWASNFAIEHEFWKGDNNPRHKDPLFGERNGMYGVHRYGEENPCYGTTYKWITNGEINRRWPKESEIPEGFRKGRCR